jgi:hypothetical protein
VAYDLYVGTTLPSEQSNSSLYMTLSQATLYAWQSNDCSAAAQYLCEMPHTAFACYPPPSPPTPPPLPPSPPSPPLSAICEPLLWQSCANRGASG